MSTAFNFLLLLAVQVFVSQATVCPKHYQNIFGVCLHFSANKGMRWCEAQAYCSSVKGELVYGDSYLPLAGKGFPGVPHHFWVGLTDFLHERDGKRDGWRWTNGSVAKSSDLQWASRVEPGNSNPSDCLFHCYGRRKLCDGGCNNKRLKIVPMCQQRLQSSSSERAIHYATSTIPVGLAANEYAENDGCSRLVTKVRSRIECSVFCSSEPDDWCVAFYFSETKEQCHLVLYTDANLDKGSAEGWVKFVRKRN